MTAGQAEALPAGGTAIKHATVVGPAGQLVGYEAVKKPMWPLNRLADSSCDLCTRPGILQPPLPRVAALSQGKTRASSPVTHIPKFLEMSTCYANVYCYNI